MALCETVSEAFSKSVSQRVTETVAETKSIWENSVLRQSPLTVTAWDREVD